MRRITYGIISSSAFKTKLSACVRHSFGRCLYSTASGIVLSDQTGPYDVGTSGSVIPEGIRRPQSDGQSRVLSSTILKTIPRLPKGQTVHHQADEVTSFTVLSKSATDTLTSLVQRWPPFRLIASHKEALLIVLVTSRFAAELTQDGDVLPAMLNRLFGDTAEQINSIETLIAVVDKVSAPNLTHAFSEGICVTSSVIDSFHTDLNSASNWSAGASRFTHSLQPEKPATLRFVLQAENAILRTRLLESSEPGSRITETSPTVRSYQVQVPLPTTLFLNGKPHTLARANFVRDARSNIWTRRRIEDIQHAEVTVPFSSHDLGKDCLSLDIPIVPLTKPQEVVSCMGNIVREVGQPNNSSKTKRPASEMLEKAVTEYFNVMRVSPHAMAVWALLIPSAAAKPEMLNRTEEMPAVQDQWRARSTNIFGDAALKPLQDLFGAGARLHRITSGGGGWGTKAGLLSLHPENSYNPQSALDQLFDPGWDGSAVTDFGMNPIAARGDLILFYCALADQDLGADTHQNPSGSEGRCQSFQVGVIPDMTDDVEVDATRGADSAEQASPAVIPNHIGILSQAGMAIRVQEVFVEEPTTRTVVHETKIDVPFARFTQHRSLPAAGHSSPSHATGSAASTNLSEDTSGTQIHSEMRHHDVTSDETSEHLQRRQMSKNHGSSVAEHDLHTEQEEQDDDSMFDAIAKLMQQSQKSRDNTKAKTNSIVQEKVLTQRRKNSEVSGGGIEWPIRKHYAKSDQRVMSGLMPDIGPDETVSGTPVPTLHDLSAQHVGISPDTSPPPLHIMKHVWPPREDGAELIRTHFAMPVRLPQDMPSNAKTDGSFPIKKYWAPVRRDVTPAPSEQKEKTLEEVAHNGSQEAKQDMGRGVKVEAEQRKETKEKRRGRIEQERNLKDVKKKMKQRNLATKGKIQKEKEDGEEALKDDEGKRRQGNLGRDLDANIRLQVRDFDDPHDHRTRHLNDEKAYRTVNSEARPHERKRHAMMAEVARRRTQDAELAQWWSGVGNHGGSLDNAQPGMRWQRPGGGKLAALVKKYAVAGSEEVHEAGTPPSSVDEERPTGARPEL